jgi:hypothetical protein
MVYKVNNSTISQLSLFDEPDEVERRISQLEEPDKPAFFDADAANTISSFQASTSQTLDASEVESSLADSNKVNLVAIDSLEVCSRYLASLQNKITINDTKNALIRYFIPAVGGPRLSVKKHKIGSPEDIQRAFDFLKTVPLTALADSPDIALKVLHELDRSITQQTRVRHDLKGLVDWARNHNYISPPINPIPEGVCDHIKVGVFEGLKLKPANARQILDRYLEQIGDRDVELNITNAVIRFFVPGCGGPVPHHKPALDYEMELGLQYLEKTPLEYLNEAPEIATVALKAFDIAMTHGTRIRNALRDLIEWSRSEQYLPKPNSVAPWGGECLPQGILNSKITTEKEDKSTLFESYQEYCCFLEQNKTKEINSFKTAVVRYFIPSCGGPIPKHIRATANELQAGLDYLKALPLGKLSGAVALTETEFERLNTPVEKRYPIRSRLRGWINWASKQDVHHIADKGENIQPAFNTFYVNGVQREQTKVGMHLHENRRPVHALCAKQFPHDYINDYLQQQLDTYEKWRKKNNVTSGSIVTEKEQILQLLGWLHRYENISLDELRFECMISKNQLIFFASNYREYYEYMRQERIGIQEACQRADDDKARTERYLEFAGKNPNSKLRRLYIVIAIAKFVYQDELGSDDFPEDRTIPILRRLLNIQVDLKTEKQATPPTIKYSKTSTSWEQAIMAMEKERLRAEQVAVYTRDRTRKGYHPQERPETAIANDLQRFLSIAFCILIPSRSRTFYDLRIGETLKEGVLSNREFLSVEDIRNRGLWDVCKNSVRFYIHHQAEDSKVGKSMTPALHESEGWWAEIPNIPCGDNFLYDYIRRWLDWGRAVKGEVVHNFFFRKAFSTEPMICSDWNQRIRKIFSRWTGVSVPPNNIRDMFTSHFPKYKESAALLLQHSESTHVREYDMRLTVDKIQPVMDANINLISSVLSNLKETGLTPQQIMDLDLDDDD